MPDPPPTIYIGYPPTQPSYVQPESIQSPVSTLNGSVDSDDGHMDMQTIEMSEIIRSTSIEYRSTNPTQGRALNSQDNGRLHGESDHSDEDNESVNRQTYGDIFTKQPMVYGGHSRVPGNNLESDAPVSRPTRPAPRLEPELSEHKFPLPPPAYSEVPPETLIGQSTIHEQPRTQVIINQPTFTPAATATPDSPQTLSCPHCRQHGTTIVRREAGFKTHMWAIGCFMIACIPITVLIYLTDCLKYSNHYCPSCQNQIPQPFIDAAFFGGGGQRVPTTTL